MSTSTKLLSLLNKKKRREKIIMLTAYDYQMATLLDDIGVDLVLVGDSLGNVFQGKKDTLSVTLDHMLYHTQVVRRGVKDALLVSDLPLLSYQQSTQLGQESVKKLRQAGADLIKIETPPASLDFIGSLVAEGVSVIAHIGFTPQYIHELGGYKIQGKTKKSADELLALSSALAALGVVGIVLEMIPQTLAKTISNSLLVPTIGIGAGPDCNGQVLVTEDLLGLISGKKPSFVKEYSDIHEICKTAITSFKTEVLSGAFPTTSHSF